ncbi:MAG: hypothetical protein ACRYG8_49320 [Janthinobacterium lividum]
MSQLSLVLLGMGIAGLAGTAVIGRVLERSLVVTLTMAPILMAVIALCLVVLGGAAWPTALLLSLWGLVGTALPVAW